VGWGVLFEQGRHRCLLAGTVSGRPEDEVVEDALWIACAEWANFEPVVGKLKASPFRRGVIEGFCAGICKFANPPTLQPLSEGWEKSAVCVAKVAASRRFQIPDGANWWSCSIPSFDPPPSLKVAGTAINPRGLLASARALLQTGSRVPGGPGEAGTG
jgi:hypothetical protein